VSRRRPPSRPATGRGRRGGHASASASKKRLPRRTARPRTRAAGTTRRKRFGQHFLKPVWVHRVVEAIAPGPGDVFLEIGPGRGALTRPLAATGVPILAVEIDRDLVAELAPTVPSHVTILSGSVLDLDPRPFLTGLAPQRPPGPAADAPPAPKRFRVVGNLPYNVATPIIAQLVAWHRQQEFFDDATVMVQREVADRLVARPGRKAYGGLTIFAQRHAQIEKLLDLPPGAFVPPPKVRSSLIRLTFGPPAVKVPDEALFDRLVKSLFMQRRKTLLNALKRFDPTAPAVLALAGLDGSRRPETLELAEIAVLARLFATVRRPAVL